MNNNNPIELVKELDFSFMQPQQCLMEVPTSFRISPNGRFMALGNREHIYLFDLHHPEQGWQNGIAHDDAEIVVPTDNGNYWIKSDTTVSLIKDKGNNRLTFSIPGYSARCIWGNDSWLLQHDNSELYSTDISSMSMKKVKHDNVIIHAWMHNHVLRLLSVSNKKKWLYLHEWDCSQNSLHLIEKKRCSVGFGIDGVEADYMFAGCHHAWPNADQSITIKLMPDTITVTADGDIQVCDDPVDWSPIIRSHAPLPVSVLARASVCALDRGLDPRSGFGTVPYLITTLQTENEIHVISTLWHKKMAISDCAHIDTSLIDQRIEADSDLGKLLLCACRDELPVQRELLTLILSELNDHGSWGKAPGYLKRIKKPILSLFTSLVSTMINKENSSPEFTTPSEMYELLKLFYSVSGLIPAFFDGLNDHRITPQDRENICQTVRLITPLLPSRIKKKIPYALLGQAIPLQHTLISATPAMNSDDLEFIISKVPSGFFSPDRLIMLLEHYQDDAVILTSIFDRIAKLDTLFRHLPVDIRKRLDELLIHALNKQHLNQIVAPHIISLMWKRGIDFSKYCTDPRYDFMYLLKQEPLQIQRIAEYLADHASDKNSLFPDFATSTLQVAADDLLIPDFLHKMAALNSASSKKDLFNIANMDDECIHRNENQLAQKLWQQTEGLEMQYRRPFAIVLLAALKHCISGNIGTIPAVYSAPPLLTAEAALLHQAATAPKPVIDEILVCV